MSYKALRILLVEDNAGDARLFREMFNKEKPESFELTHLLRMSEAYLCICFATDWRQLPLSPGMLVETVMGRGYTLAAEDCY